MGQIKICNQAVVGSIPTAGFLSINDLHNTSKVASTSLPHACHTLRTSQPPRSVRFYKRLSPGNTRLWANQVRPMTAHQAAPSVSISDCCCCLLRGCGGCLPCNSKCRYLQLPSQIPLTKGRLGSGEFAVHDDILGGRPFMQEPAGEVLPCRFAEALSHSIVNAAIPCRENVPAMHLLHVVAGVLQGVQPRLQPRIRRRHLDQRIANAPKLGLLRSPFASLRKRR